MLPVIWAPGHPEQGLIRRSLPWLGCRLGDWIQGQHFRHRHPSQGGRGRHGTNCATAMVSDVHDRSIADKGDIDQ